MFRRVQFRSITIGLVSVVTFLSTFAFATPTSTSIYDFTLKELNGKPYQTSVLKDKVVLVVNTASKCGFTPQYKDLEDLYQHYKDKGVVVLGFPSNDFGNLEPGTNKEIQQFCKLRYGVTFPVFEKGSVVGANQQPIFKTIIENAPEDQKGEIEWNFEKFLIDKKGKVRAHFGSFVNPMSNKITAQVEDLISENS